MKIKISLLQKEDCVALAKMVQETCRESFKFFYPQSWIEYTINRQTPQRFWEKAQTMHFYVAKIGKQIVGCAGISPYFDKADECVIVSFFVSKKFHGKGIGTQLLKHLEKDEIYVRSKRVEVASSLNALPFYIKNGFHYKNNEFDFDNGSLHLEKNIIINTIALFK